MIKCLIIGSSGFVGHHLVRELSDEMEIISADRNKKTFSSDKSTNVYIDILNQNSIIDVLEKHNPNYIINLAAISSVRTSWENPKLTFEVNLLGTINIIESIIKTNTNCRLLIIGSSEQYGIPNSLPINEKNQTNSANFYGLSKFTQEEISKIFMSKYNLDIVFTRSFNHVGPYQNPIFLLPSLCKQIVEMENNEIANELIVGNLDIKRDFTDVRDVAKAYKLLLKNGIAGETYNIGSGKSLSIKDLIFVISNHTKVKFKILVDNEKIRTNEVMDIYADISKITSLGWFPLINIEKTVEDTLNYYRGIRKNEK